MTLTKVEYEFFDFEEASAEATELHRQVRFHFSDAPSLFASWTWESNGWSCREPKKYPAAQLRQWEFAGQAVFPLHFNPSDRRPDNDAVRRFPRSVSDDSLIAECTTGWIRVEPGTEQTSDALGYIQVQESGTRMAIYQLWGEI